ncbi:hypothetical protein [Acinetobacter sp. P1(2025)]|uniref:hypothetical protein n=1 Tax=Acinetobacter sp. P1(2025) TaxID=3446120 RepID=UPI003F5327E3
MNDTEINGQIIYKGYSGNSISYKLVVCLKGGKYCLILKKFKRAMLSDRERKLGFKTGRILLFERSYFFSNLSKIDSTRFPCPDLIEDFLVKNLKAD